MQQPYELPALRLPLPDIFFSHTGDRKRSAGVLLFSLASGPFPVFPERTAPMNLDKTFIDFFVQRGHIPTTGSSLIPRPGDPVLFTTSGMHPLTPIWKANRIHSAAGWSGCSDACAPPISTRSVIRPT